MISPELGIAQPGLTLVCPDSHTCSQGALGALAWGIGSTDAEHAIVTGTMRVKKPPQMRISVIGTLGACLLYTSPSPRDATLSRMPSSA